MREYKFRGKRKDGGGFEYGDLITKAVHHECVILENGVINHSIDPTTVGQFTGLKDKNGKEIYEGDILSAERTVTGIPLPNGKVAEVFGNIPTKKRTWNEILVVEMTVNEKSISFVLPEEGGTYQERGKKLEWEIIGNIHENPDLIPQT